MTLLLSCSSCCMRKVISIGRVSLQEALYEEAAFCSSGLSTTPSSNERTLKGSKKQKKKQRKKIQKAWEDMKNIY